MQILFKQTEIEAALRMYVEASGISLKNKTVEISFTAGRGASGLTAEVDIEPATEIPGFAEEEPAPVSLQVVPNDKPQTEEPQETEVEELRVEVLEKEEEPAVKSGTSLFT